MYQNEVKFSGDVVDTPTTGEYNGRPKASVVLVHKSTYGDKEKLNYATVTGWGDLAGQIKALSKGDNVSAEGAIAGRSYIDKKDGSTRYFMDVTAKTISVNTKAEVIPF